MENRRPCGQARSTPISHVPTPKRHPYDQWSPDTRALDLVGDKWTLLIIRDLSSGPRRFVELQRTLPGISTEQLRSRLNRMVADGLLTRARYREVPPRVDYELTDRSHALMSVLGAVARWGLDWAWGPPRPEEELNLGALLRLLPGLLPGQAHIDGVAELVVEQVDGSSRSYVVNVHAGEASLTEGPQTPVDARVRGDEPAWVAALGPAADASDLRFEGSRDLAGQLLAAFAAPRSQASASQA